jgi:hypothetical protein
MLLASRPPHPLLAPDDNLLALQRIERLLTGDGFYAMIDVFRAEGEPRDRYLQRWIATAKARYREVQPAEKEKLFDHVRACDFPLSLDAWRALGEQAGMPRFEVLLDDRDGLNRLVAMGALTSPHNPD